MDDYKEETCSPSASGNPVYNHVDSLIIASEAENDDVRPIMEGVTDTLPVSKVHDVFCKATSDYAGNISSLPPVQPRGATVFLFNLGDDEAQWELKKKKFRCDQYRWIHQGTRTLNHPSGVTIYRKSSVIDADSDDRHGDKRFKRHEYWGVGQHYIIHYIGDDTIFQNFAHRNSKEKSRPFIHSAPHIKNKVLDKNPMLMPKKIYRNMVNESDGGPRHSIDAPRDVNQVSNFRKEISRQFRISHDALFNVYQLCFQLFTTAPKGEKIDFITFFGTHPNILIHMLYQPLLDVMEKVLRLSHDTVCLHYDTVFNIGDFYLSTVTFRHMLFKKNPVMPFAFFIHSRKFHDNHVDFLKYIRKKVPLLATKRIIIVTDQEFNLSEIFPAGVHAFCWNHLERDLHFHLKQKANCTATEISYFANAFKRLMNEPSEVEFSQLWESLKISPFFKKNNAVEKYFETKLIPTFKSHSAIWVLKSAGLRNPNNGITNNASESMNAVLHSLQNWKSVPLDVICVSLFHLCCYYEREVLRGIHQCGSLDVAAEYSIYKRDPTLMPKLMKCTDPKEIVERAKGSCQQLCQSSQSDQQQNTNTQSLSLTANTQVGLAIDTVNKKLVTLADAGCWLVRSVDGTKPYAVTLLPKESCSCAAKKMCYHIMACRLMIGQIVEHIQKPNMSLLLEQNRRKNKDKPSGRKRPRKEDVDTTTDESENPAKGHKTDGVGESTKKMNEEVTDGVRSYSDDNTQQQGSDGVQSCFDKTRQRVQQDIGTVNDSMEANEESLLFSNEISRAVQLSYYPPFTNKLLSSRSSNVKADRLFCSGQVSWEDFLDKFGSIFPNKLLCSHVCKTSLNEEITNLDEGEIVVIQTQRSNQIVILKRINDQNLPVVEVISPYSNPDIQELRYHTATAIRHSCDAAIVTIMGTVFNDRLADEFAAVMLVLSFVDPALNLTRIKPDPKFINEDIMSFMRQKEMKFHYEEAKSDCSVTQKLDVDMLCFCMTAWLDGTTSKAVYGEQQKEFNMYQCCFCSMWYHKYCLKTCGLKVPGRKDDFICILCQVPQTIPWRVPGFTDTCTFDNFYTVLLLHCQQDTDFIMKMGDSEFEKVLKAGLRLMLTGSIEEGKVAILKHMQMASNVIGSSFYGHEFDKTLAFLKFVWSIYVTKKCPSPHCPRTEDEVRSMCHFSFNLPNVDGEFLDQVKKIFPHSGDVFGTCCGKFSRQPPHGALCGLNHKTLVDKDNKERTEYFYECNGQPTVKEAKFTYASPWMIPFNVAQLSGYQCEQLPRVILVFDRIYRLAGYSLHSVTHYTAVINWHGKDFFYNGLGSTNEKRFLELSLEHLRQQGSYAYYFLSH